MKRYLQILLKYRIPVLVFIFIITAFFGYCAKDMRTDNSIEIWLSENDKDLSYYNTFLERFGEEEFLVVAFDAANLFTKERIREINVIAENIKILDGVVAATSLASVFEDKITSPLFKKKLQASENRTVMNIFRQEVLKDPLYRNTILSERGKTTAIIATVRCSGPESRKKLVAEVKKLLRAKVKQFAGRRHKYHLAGPSVVNAELDRMSKRDMAKFTPLMFFISIAVLGVLFRNISGVLIPVLNVGVCMVWITGTFVLFGQSMNMIANMLLPLTFIISLAASVRFINYYYYERNIYETLRHIGIPIFMAGITTAISFASFTTSDIPSVFITGLFMSGCAILSFLMSMTLVPMLLSFIPVQRSTNLRNTSHASCPLPFLSLSRIGRFTAQNKGIILSVALVVGIASVIGISRLRPESDIMASFPKRSSIAKDNDYIEKRLMGLLPVEIVAETTNGTSVFQPKVLNSIVSLQGYLDSVPEITSSLSITDYIRKVNLMVSDNKTNNSTIPKTRNEAVDYVKLASVYGDPYVNKFFSGDHTAARISVRVKQVGSQKYKTIINSIKEYINNTMNTVNLSWCFTGIVPLMINVQDNLLRSEIWSFSLAFISTFIVTAIALKSARIGLISIIPNIIPITITLGVMGYTGIKLDAATIMIASIALGISVDDTIHIFYRFKEEFAIDGKHSEAICRTMQQVGRAAVFTSLTAALGFMVFSFSSFKPIRYFGVLTSITMLSALVSDLFISPSCLMLFKYSGGLKSFHTS